MDLSSAFTSELGFVCVTQLQLKSKGMFYGESPFTRTTQLLLLQISISSLLITVIHYLLTPFAQTAFVAQMIGGIILGPSVLGGTYVFTEKLFPESSLYFGQTFALFGCMIFLFLVGVKMDLHMIKKSGRRGVVIGTCHFSLPLLVVGGLSYTIRKNGSFDPVFSNSLYCSAALATLSSSHVITCLLTEMNILNTELGRLALSSSMVSGLFSWALALIAYIVFEGSSGPQKQGNILALGLCFSFLFTLFLVFYFFRPIIHWMIEKTAQGKSVKEVYVFSIFVMILLTALVGELTGQHFLVGPILLGMFTPDGPPLGPALIDKLETFTSAILLPLFYVLNVAKADMTLIAPNNLVALGVIKFGSSVTKIVGVMLPAMYYKMPLEDALSLGLVMSAQGICEVIIAGRSLVLGYIDNESYSILILCMILFTGAISPVVKVLYKPRIYRSHRRRTILHSRPDSELRLLACIYRDNCASSLLNLLEVSNPNMESPICFYLVHLVDLQGRSSSTLVAHRMGKKTPSRAASSEHIINAFRMYQQQNIGTLTVNPFTSIAPYATIHQDVCELALDKRVAMVIIPFHKRFSMDPTENTAACPIRVVNRNILESSPCSVGILVDRGTLSSSTVLFTTTTSYRIAVLFLGGPDDREALAYGMRMAEHPYVELTVVQLIETRRKMDPKLSEMGPDYELMNEFKLANVGSRTVVFVEEEVADGLEVITRIQELENNYELVLVGRSHADDSKIFGGSTEWNEFPELGYIGDILATSDSKCQASLLVVQQQLFVGDGPMESFPFIDGPAYSVVDMDKMRKADLKF